MSFGTGFDISTFLCIIVETSLRIGEKMEKQRLKMKIGEHEFDAEGPPDVVQKLFEAWEKLVLRVPSQKTADPATTENTSEKGGSNDVLEVDGQLDHIMRLEERIVSLTVPPDGVDEAVLLILFGQKVLRENDSVTGAELMDGLRVSGQTVGRVDRLLEKASNSGDVIVIGQKRAKRYRLTNKGLTRARSIAKEQIEIVA